ncbi:alpha/beta-hydrolase [Mycena leptocephala]|nr:alpha/beta-hydrolase [Mycena leptocephala]
MVNLRVLSHSLPLLALLPVALSWPIRPRASSTVAQPSAVSLGTMNQTLLRPAQLASLAYCSSETIISGTCGTPCDALSKARITFLQIGGDGGKIPLYYIAHDEDEQSLVIAHEGTDAQSILSLLNDAEFSLAALNVSRFPSSAGLNITVHSGFQETFERTADDLLTGVIAGLASTGVKKIIVTGHSLGAAYRRSAGTHDWADDQERRPPSVQVSVTGFGVPRGGNQEWADFIDAKASHSLFSSSKTRLHLRDQPARPRPAPPASLLRFYHSSGEIHITDSTGKDFVACPGQDNEDCITGNNVLTSNIFNHLGPYFDDISFGGRFCSS